MTDAASSVQMSGVNRKPLAGAVHGINTTSTQPALSKLLQVLSLREAS